MDMNQAEIYKDLFQLTRIMFLRLQGRIQPYYQISNQLKIYLNQHQSRNYKDLKSLLFDEPLNIKLEQDSDPSKEQVLQVSQKFRLEEEIIKQKQLQRTSKHKVYCKLCRKYYKDNLNLIRHQYVQHGINYIFDYPENYVDQTRPHEIQDKQNSFNEILYNSKLFEEQDNENQILNTIAQVDLFNQIHPIQCKKISDLKWFVKHFRKLCRLKTLNVTFANNFFLIMKDLQNTRLSFIIQKKNLYNSISLLFQNSKNQKQIFSKIHRLWQKNITQLKTHNLNNQMIVKLLKLIILQVLINEILNRRI
ncbi:hypothetical protein pb186bvf_004371 [Paramecium bursaria]